ncbi:MAG: restriction endonuclease subunit S [Nocardioides sp.]
MVSVTLPEVLSQIVDNRGRSCPTSLSGFPLIATNCLKQGHRAPVFENVRYVDDRTLTTWFRAHLQPGDVLFVCKGSPGRVAVVPDPVPFCIAQDMVALRAAPDVIDPGYLYYRLTAPDVQSSIVNMHVGTMIPHFKKGDFGKLGFEIHPSLLDQRAIAEVLGALDDKIAANDRVVSTVAQLARGMFSRAASDGDCVALGKVAPLVTRGVAPKYVEGEGQLILNQKCVRDQTVSLGPARRMSPLQSRFDRLLRRDDVLVNSTGQGTLGRVARWTLNVEATVDTHITLIRFNALDVDPVCAGYAVLALERQIEGLAQGSTGQTELRRDLLAALELRVPPCGRQGEVSRKLTHLDGLSNGLRAESETLARTRDELLPLLMSGKVRVRDAEKTVEEVL